MGFFDSIGNIVEKVVDVATLPVTAPLSVIEKANIPIASAAAGGIADLTRLPGTIAGGGSGSTVIRNAVNQIAPAVSAVSGIPGGSQLVQSLTGAIPGGSLLTGLMGPPPDSLNQEPAPAPVTAIPQAPVLQRQTNLTVPFILATGAVVLGLYLRRKK